MAARRGGAHDGSAGSGRAGRSGDRRRAERFLSRRRARGAGWRCRGADRQPAGRRLCPRGPHPGLAPGGPCLVRLAPSGPQAVRERRHVLWRPDALARPLRARDAGRGVPPLARVGQGRTDRPQGVPARDRFLLGLVRERPAHGHRARRLPARTRLPAGGAVRARLRFLRPLVGPRRPCAGVRGPGGRGRLPGDRPHGLGGRDPGRIRRGRRRSGAERRR